MIDIRDEAFWKSLRVRKDDPAGAELRHAIKLGLEGKREAAWKAINAYHRIVLADRLTFYRQIFAGETDATDEAVEQLLASPPTVNRTTGQYSQNQRFYFFRSPVRRLMEHGDDERLQQFVGDVLANFYRDRHLLHVPKLAEHPIFGALGFGFKIETWIPAYIALIFSDKGCPPTATEAVLKIMLGGGRWLQGRVKPFRVHNVHTSAVGALFTVARIFPEFRESVAWDRLASRYLHRTIKQSFFDDGGHKERVWGYGYYTVWRLQDLYLLGKARGGFGAFDDDYRNRLREAYRWFAKTLGPDELKPSYGDCELFSGSPILDRGEAMFPETEHRDFGVDRGASYFLPESGFAIMRNGGGPTATYINTSFGKFAGWHSHHDVLSMNLWAHNRPLLEELGRFGSYGNPLDLLFRAPESHNQMLIDGMHYDARDQPAKDVCWYSDRHVDYFSAYHTCYRWLPNKDGCAYVISMNAIVRRTIILVKHAGYALVLDSVRDEEADTFNRAVTSHWHSPFGFEVIDKQRVRTGLGPEGQGCVLTFAHGKGLKDFIVEPDYAGEDAATGELYPERWHLRTRRWYSEAYQGCTGFATVLQPFAGRVPKVVVTPLAMAGGVRFRAEGFEVTTPSGTDTLLLNPELMPGLQHGRTAVKGRAKLRVGGRSSWIDIA
jgi:hypothetical protein